MFSSFWALWWWQRRIDLCPFPAALWFKLLYQVSGLAVNEDYCNTQAVTSTFSNGSFTRDLKGSSRVTDGKCWIACYKVLSKQSLMWPTFIPGALMSRRPFKELVQTMTALFVYWTGMAGNARRASGLCFCSQATPHLNNFSNGWKYLQDGWRLQLYI